jgi:hypothetical protein
MESMQQGDITIEERKAIIENEFGGDREKYIIERVLKPISKEEMRVIIDNKLKKVEEYRKDLSKMPVPKGYNEEWKMGDLSHEEARLKDAEYMLTGGHGGFEKNIWAIRCLTDTLTSEEEKIINGIFDVATLAEKVE